MIDCILGLLLGQLLCRQQTLNIWLHTIYFQSIALQVCQTNNNTNL